MIVKDAKTKTHIILDVNSANFFSELVLHKYGRRLDIPKKDVSVTLKDKIAKLY